MGEELILKVLLEHGTMGVIAGVAVWFAIKMAKKLEKTQQMLFQNMDKDRERTFALMQQCQETQSKLAENLVILTQGVVNIETHLGLEDSVGSISRRARAKRA